MKTPIRARIVSQVGKRCNSEGVDELFLQEPPEDFTLVDLIKGGELQIKARANLRGMWELLVFPFFEEGFLFSCMDDVGLTRFNSVCYARASVSVSFLIDTHLRRRWHGCSLYCFVMHLWMKATTMMWICLFFAR